MGVGRSETQGSYFNPTYEAGDRTEVNLSKAKLTFGDIMILNHEMAEVFDKENLIYAHPENLLNTGLPQDTVEFILNTGFPRLLSYFRFSMDFEPLAADIQIGEFTKQLGEIFTIGCKGATQLIGRTVHLSSIGLTNNASLSDIARRIRLLDIEDVVFSSEVALAYRIGYNLENNGEIISINPVDLSVVLLNSSIQQLAASTSAYWKNLFPEQEVDVGLLNFEKELKTIDSKALQNQDSLWIRVIEQILQDEEGY